MQLQVRFGFDSVPNTCTVYRTGKVPGVMNGAKLEENKLNSQFWTSNLS